MPGEPNGSLWFFQIGSLQRDVRNRPADHRAAVDPGHDAGGVDGDAAVLDPVAALLDEALREPVADMPAARVAKLVRRSKRVTTQAMTAVADKVLGVQYLSLALFTADLAERDIIIVGPESPFAKAWDMMAEIMDLARDDLAQSEAEAAARELARVLGGMGFYTA